MEIKTEVKTMMNEETEIKKEEKMEIEKNNKDDLVLIYYFGTNYYEM